MAPPVFTEYATALEAAGEGQTVCGTLMPDGEPRYFVMDAEADDDDVHDVAFEIRHGTPPDEYTDWLRDQARALLNGELDSVLAEKPQWEWTP